MEALGNEAPHPNALSSSSHTPIQIINHLIISQKTFSSSILPTHEPLLNWLLGWWSGAKTMVNKGCLRCEDDGDSSYIRLFLATIHSSELLAPSTALHHHYSYQRVAGETDRTDQVKRPEKLWPSTTVALCHHTHRLSVVFNQLPHQLSTTITTTHLYRIPSRLPLYSF